MLDNCKSTIAREDSSGKTWGLRAYWAVCRSQSCLGRIPGAPQGCCCRYVLAFGCQCMGPGLFPSPSPVQGRENRCSAAAFAGVPTVSITPAWGSLSNTEHCGRSIPRMLQGLQAPDLKPACVQGGSDQSGGQLGCDTFPRTKSSILALTFSGDLWWLC